MLETTDWIEILIRGTYEVSISSMKVSGEEIGELQGSGHIGWKANSGIRIQCVTTGAEMLNKISFVSNIAPGKLISHTTYVACSGCTYDGWNVVTDLVPRDGHSTHFDKPEVIWDHTTTGIYLHRELPGETWRQLRVLIGPVLHSWPRWTKTEVHNDFFGKEYSRRDWLKSVCSLGTIAARQRTDDWFEVCLRPIDTEEMRDSPDVTVAIANSFSFILGRHCAIRGYEECNRNLQKRRLNTRYQDIARSQLWQPLRGPLGSVGDVEQLLGKAIDFFLTDEGKHVASLMHLCWDTVDNDFQTRLAISCICVEGLLRIAAESLGPTSVSVSENDLTAFKKWLASAPTGFSENFLNRLKGIPGMFKNKSPKDILWDWKRRGVLDISEKDIESWSQARNASAHAQHFGKEQSQKELQIDIDRHTSVVNLLNRIILQLIGYSGVYIDYSKPGHPSTVFPNVNSSAEIRSVIQ